MHIVSKLHVKINFIINFNGSASAILSNNKCYFFFSDTLPYLYAYYWEEDYNLEI